jgi:prefoldin subunit 5
MDQKIALSVHSLVRERQTAGAELDARRRELKSNERLLNEGRRVYHDSRGRKVCWRGAWYRPEQMQEQLRLLFNEHTVLETAVERLRKVTEELDQRIIETRVLGTRVNAERGLLGSRISLVRAGQLAGNLNRIAAEVEKLTSDAVSLFDKSASIVETLRTTRELGAARDSDEPSEFEKWLRDDPA